MAMDDLSTLGQQYQIISKQGIHDHARITFDGTVGATGTITLFTVTGLVALQIYPYAEVVPVSAGGGTLALGSATLTTGIVTTTTATAIHANFDWIATPAALVADTATNFPTVVTGENIILTIGTATITAGRLSFNVFWRPLSKGASVVSGFVGGSSSPSISPSASDSPSASTSPSASLSPSSSASASASKSLSPSASSSPSSSASKSLSPSASASPSGSVSPSASPSPSFPAP